MYNAVPSLKSVDGILVVQINAYKQYILAFKSVDNKSPFDLPMINCTLIFLSKVQCSGKYYSLVLCIMLCQVALTFQSIGLFLK